VAVHPSVSSVALARARLGWSAETVEVVRDAGTVPRHLAPGRRIIVLSRDRSTPSMVAKTLCENGFGASRLTVLADLGGPDESVVHTLAHAWSGEAPRLHVLAVECVGATVLGLAPGLPDDAYEHDGQLTKRDVRASALAHLAPQPGQLLWDVGAGAGSVAVEWMRAHPTCRAVAVERDPHRAARIARNAARLGVPGLRVVTAEAPSALTGLERPHAVFVGGGAGVPDLLDTCWTALSPGGRLVAHAVTLQTEAVLVRMHERHGGELTRISVERAAPLGSMTGWTPARAVVQWAVVVPAVPTAVPTGEAP
jgi:precorrin-6Y C5,15-methyltransferase (decarboxylating)